MKPEQTLKSGRRRRGCRLWAALSLAGCILALMLPAPAGAGEVDKAMKREIRISERFISDMLAESPNWLVRHGGPNEGTYIDGVGLVFHFEASLVSGHEIRIHKRGLSILRDIGKNTRVWDDDDDGDEDEPEPDEDAGDLQRYYQQRKARHDRKAEQNYAAGREELYLAMVDAADVVRSLGDQESIFFVVVLDDHEYFRQNHLDRLVLKGSAGDLRAFAERTPDLDQLKKRISEIEY